MGSGKVIIVLRHGMTAAPQKKNHLRLKVDTEDLTFGVLAKAIPLALKPGAGKKVESVSDIIDIMLNVAEMFSVDISDNRLDSNDDEEEDDDGVTFLIKEKLDDGVFDDVIKEKLVDV